MVTALLVFNRCELAPLLGGMLFSVWVFLEVLQIGITPCLCIPDSKTECLTLTATEVIKRQSSKSKKSFNQVTWFNHCYTPCWFVLVLYLVRGWDKTVLVPMDCVHPYCQHVIMGCFSCSKLVCPRLKWTRSRSLESTAPLLCAWTRMRGRFCTVSPGRRSGAKFLAAVVGPCQSHSHSRNLAVTSRLDYYNMFCLGLPWKQFKNFNWYKLPLPYLLELGNLSM